MNKTFNNTNLRGGSAFRSDFAVANTIGRLLASGWRTFAFLYASAAILTLMLALLPSPVHATHNPLITAQCHQAVDATSAVVANGSEIVVARGDPLLIILTYYHGSDGDVLYAANFTATINTNSLTGPEHTFDTQTRWGGAGWAEGGAKDVPLDTSMAPFGRDRIIINVTSDATGTEVLATCDFTLVVLPPDGDEDGDGLMNRWETNGIDVNNDGTIELKLGGEPYNAQWNHKDIFIEADYMDCAVGGCPPDNPTGNHKPEGNVLGNVAGAFAAAPVSNPDGSSGINLHVYLDDAVPYRRLLLFRLTSSRLNDGTFDELKSGDASNPCDGYFGMLAERLAPDCAAKLQARKMAFRYVLFGDLIADYPSAVGIAELPGNDFFVQVQRDFRGGSSNLAQSEQVETNTFMHELGHTLGLGHGGADEFGCKPNYLSVMNYMQAWEKFNPSQFPLDYSRQALPTLNENSLSEMAGISGPMGRVARYSVNGKQRSADAGGPIDWNNNGLIDGTTVAADINWISVFINQCASSPGQMLNGHDDWHSLLYDFRQTSDYADYRHETARPEDELTRDVLEQLKDDDLDTIINADDNCVSVPNTNQADRDRDNVGDACDPDSDPPTVNLVTPPDGAVYTLGSSILADYSCADEPGGSGLASCSGTVANGATIDTNSVGVKTFVVTAQDGEGHQTVVTHYYQVAYVFEGFFPPVDNNLMNITTAGQTIPLRWRLTDSLGNAVANLATVNVTVASLSVQYRSDWG